ncbi:hypothetical protein BCV69DRAFT_257017 [Microstroma glucosiphilum]|uniref:P-loop containing nucleoside triphosphate hydrolase protein n=1 Tax=Pseudomicrostroma glucosiphilum TaxID=1684307 RepID=A0A316UGJ3_9BASI|nr:hypothetical protein BCV69DRAFT_257017 [Pseudomicrostroma glucosiphilum]PWN22275.1 hypothetical protein BCV69DRAFT_257017 [Pseudomicrostroma glucosiphilum]
MLGCSKVHDNVDWTPCFREKFLNTALPLGALLVSLFVFLLQYAHSTRKHKRSAKVIAQLDPSASNFATARLTGEGGVDGQRVDQRSSLFSRAAKNLPSWRSSKNNAKKGKGLAGEPVSAATVAVFRTENAMILNEVHSIPLRQLSAPELARKRVLDTSKRCVDTFGAIIIASLHAAGWMMGGGRTEAVWSTTWIYLAVLGGFSLGTSHSLYSHKTAIFLIYFVVAISNLRSTVISHEEFKADLVLAAVKLAAAGLILIPTLFFPLESKVPAHLAAIHRTMQARSQFGVPGTAIPSPAPSSPLLRAQRDDEASADLNNGDLLDRLAARNAEEKIRDEAPPPPEVQASLYSRLYFSFVTPAMIKHYKTQFTLPAVPDLPPGDKAAAVVASFRAESNRDTNDKSGDASTLVPSNRPLAGRLIWHYRSLLLLQIMWAAVEAALEMSPAVGLRALLAYLEERDAERNGGAKAMTPVHMAVLYAVAMGVGQALGAICASQSLFIGRRICIRLRAILITEIISKALRKSDVSRTTSEETSSPAEGVKKTKGKEDDKQLSATDGQIANLVSVDVFKVSEVCAYLHFVFPQAPLILGLALYLLYSLLGWSALAGFAVLAAAMPAQALVARFFVKLQKQLLEATDKRLNLTTEVLNCIKTVKFFAWEEAFAARLGEARARELRVLRKRSFAWLLATFFYFGSPVLVTVVTFGIHTQVRKQALTAETAFTALALFNLIRNPLDALPDMIVNILSALVSVRRIDSFLREPETLKYEQLLRNEADGPPNPSDPVVGFEHATFVFGAGKSDAGADSDGDATSAEQSFALKDLTLHFPEGKLSIITGPVGAGKTCLLLSLLGETRRVSGRTFMPCPIARALEPVNPATGLSNTVAYVSQSAWLLGTTVKENILFGSPYNDQRYRSVLKACSLEPDLKILEYHDETEVGEKGTSLSGGQKARVALARALYSSARYILIDDALSAVDAHTAEHLYKEYLLGPLMSGRTCLLVTHSVSLVLPGASYAVVLDNGRVTRAGPADELAADGVFDHETGPRSVKPTENGLSNDKGASDDEANPIIEEVDDNARAHEEAEIKIKQDRKKVSKLEETFGQGAVGAAQYYLYARSFFKSAVASVVFWIVAVILFLASRGTDVANSAWLRKWAASYSPHLVKEQGHTSQELGTLQQMIYNQGPAHASQVVFANGNTTAVSSLWQPITALMADKERPDLTLYYLKIYLLISFAFIALSILRDAAVVVGSVSASRNIYIQMTDAVLRARPQFFDRTPVGRIINRFSKDLETLDQEISGMFLFLIDRIIADVIILVVASYALPFFIVFAIFVIMVFTAIGALYIVSSRDLKRIESVQRSPIFTLVGEVLGGAVAIRAYGDAARFTRHCLRLVDKASRPFFFLWYENRWLSMRVDSSAGMVSIVMGLGIIYTKSIDAALAGFAFSFTIQLVDAALWTVRCITINEINFNSVERIGEYLKIEPERSIGTEPPAAWPSSSGNIVVEDLTVRYTPEFEPVLKNVSFEIQPGEKVGIVGRTGSGKSTLALSFFRFLEAEAGQIIIDGISISSVPLKTLRQRLTVIPQDAQLFSGTVRSNLDPFSQYEEGELWQALQRCKLASSGATPAASRAPTRPGSPVAGEGSSLFTSLNAPIEQGGRNLSAGQRQLLALARGLLKMRDSRILILDESTANLDTASDQQIQRTIRKEMAPGATILVIAHRLRTIIDFDKILVLDKGNVLEYDAPLTLLQDEKSSFWELCARSGELEMLQEMAETAAEEKKKRLSQEGKQVR